MKLKDKEELNLEEKVEVQEEAINETVEETKTEKKAELSKELKAIVANLKLTHKKIYKNTVDGEVVLWKPLSRAEYRQVFNVGEGIEDKVLLAELRDAEIIRQCVLYPETETLIEKAGVSIILSELILEKSGFDISETEEL